MKDKNEDIEIIYNLNNKNKNKLQIFGSTFVKNNKDKYFIIYNNQQYELAETFDNFNINEINQDKLAIKLKGINNITDATSMFSGCASLISLPDLSKWDTSKINSIKYMFYSCNSLISLSDISK